jgi:hypothetical protein
MKAEEQKKKEEEEKLKALSAQAIIEATLPKVCPQNAQSRRQTHEAHRGASALVLPPILRISRREMLRVRLLRLHIPHPYL